MTEKKQKATELKRSASDFFRRKLTIRKIKAPSKTSTLPAILSVENPQTSNTSILHPANLFENPRIVLSHVAEYFSKEVTDELDAFSDDTSTQSTRTISSGARSLVGFTNRFSSASSRPPFLQKELALQSTTWPLPTRPKFGRSISEPMLNLGLMKSTHVSMRPSSISKLGPSSSTFSSSKDTYLGPATLLVSSPRSSPLSNEIICNSDELELEPLPKSADRRMDNITDGRTNDLKPRSKTKTKTNFERTLTLGETSEKETLRQGIMAHQRNDMTLSAILFERCAKENGGTGVGMLMWALALRHGWGCPVDAPKAFGWLQLSIETLLRELNFSKLEKQRYDELNSFEKSGKDPVVMYYLLNEIKGIKSELLLGLYELGQCLMHGWGCQRDKELAVQYYRMAANLGDADAQKELAYCYEIGNGVKKSTRSAAKYYRMACQQGIKMMGYQWIWKEKYNSKNS